MKEIKAVIQPFMVEKTLDALLSVDRLPGVTLSEVRGWGRTQGRSDAEKKSGAAPHGFASKIKLEIVVPDRLAPEVVDVITRIAHTGRPGDGKIFVSDVENVVRVRTGEQGERAI